MLGRRYCDVSNTGSKSRSELHSSPMKKLYICKAVRINLVLRITKQCSTACTQKYLYDSTAM